MKQITLLLLVFQSTLWAQSVTVSGKVLQKDTSVPLEFASVSIINQDNQPVASGVTNQSGAFSLGVAPGNYVVKVSFVGYKDVVHSASLLKDETLPILYLTPEQNLLETVDINTEKSTIEHQLDKKVFNVGKELVSKGGTANDILIMSPLSRSIPMVR